MRLLLIEVVFVQKKKITFFSWKLFAPQLQVWQEDQLRELPERAGERSQVRAAGHPGACPRVSTDDAHAVILVAGTCWILGSWLACLPSPQVRQQAESLGESQHAARHVAAPQPTAAQPGVRSLAAAVSYTRLNCFRTVQLEPKWVLSQLGLILTLDFDEEFKSDYSFQSTTNSLQVNCQVIIRFITRPTGANGNLSFIILASWGAKQRRPFSPWLWRGVSASGLLCVRAASNSLHRL